MAISLALANPIVRMMFRDCFVAKVMEARQPSCEVWATTRSRNT